MDKRGTFVLKLLSSANEIPLVLFSKTEAHLSFVLENAISVFVLPHVRGFPNEKWGLLKNTLFGALVRDGDENTAETKTIENFQN